MTTYLGKSCSFCLPRVPFVNCRKFMYLVIFLLVLRAGYGIWLYQFLIIAYLFTFRAIVFLTCQPRWIRIRAGTCKHQIRSQCLGHEGCLWNKCQCLLSLFFIFFVHQRCIPGGAWMLPSVDLRQALTFFMSYLHESGPRTRDPLIYSLKYCRLMLAD